MKCTLDKSNFITDCQLQDNELIVRVDGNGHFKGTLLGKITSIDQHQNTTYAGLAGLHMLCFGAGLCWFFQPGREAPGQAAANWLAC